MDLPDFSDDEPDVSHLSLADKYKPLEATTEAAEPAIESAPAAHAQTTADAESIASSQDVQSVNRAESVSTEASALDADALEAEEVAHLPRSASPVAEAELTEHQLLAWSESSKVWKAYKPRKAAATPTGKVGNVRVITYNVWFNEGTDRRLRHRALFKLCLSSKREVDLICLQEMTEAAYAELIGTDLFDKDDPLRLMAERATKLLKKDWLASEFLPQSLLFKQGIWFGTVILVNRHFATRLAHKVSVRSIPLPSAASRRLHYVEFEHDGKPVFRAATFHLDGAPIAVEMRKRQLLVSAKHLCAEAVPALMCGDTNIVTFDELAGVVGPPYRLIEPMAHFDTRPTYNATYVLKDANTFRIDLVLLTPDFEAKAGEVLGSRPFPLPEGVAKPRIVGKGGYVFPSDHLGVFVHARHKGEASLAEHL